MSGWVAMQRDLLLKGHPLFAPEPFTKVQAWGWIIARAAWEDTDHFVGGSRVDVPRGSFFCTLRELQKTWGWGSDTKVRAFLGSLEKERMVRCKKNAGKTHVTVCKYEVYQTSERKENADKTHGKTQEKRTKEEINKITNTTADEARGEIHVLTHRENLLIEMGHDATGMRANGKLVGNQSDMGFVTQWSDELGLSEQEQLAVVAEVIAKRQGEPPPVTFKYFNGAMSDFSGIKSRPKLVPTAGGQYGQSTNNSQLQRDAELAEEITAAARAR